MSEVIVGIGEILWDVFPSKRELGGAPANFVYHASQFGFEAYMISAVGQDRDGDEIVDSLRKKGVRHFTFRAPSPTGTVMVAVEPDGVPSYKITENVAWDYIPYSENMEELVDSTVAVYFGSLAQRNKVSRQTIIRFLEKVPSTALKIFDINLRQRFYSKSLIENSLSRCNVLKINDEELAVVAELLKIKKTDPVEICQDLVDKYQLRILILTCGAKGSYVITEDAVSFNPTPSIVVVDTVGAGDSFSAAFVVALLKGKSIEEAHRLAVEVSAFVCTQRGAMPLLPDNLIDQLL